MSDEIKKRHSVILENRKNMVLTGIEDVLSFDENAVVMQTVQGKLTVKGNALHISGFNRETGDLQMDGTVSVFGYTDSSGKDSGFFGRIFK